MAKKAVEKVKEWLAIIVIVLSLISGGATFAWCKIAVPEVKKIAKKEQEETAILLQKLLEETEFQNYLIMSEKTVDDIKEAKNRWLQFKIEKRK